MKKTTIIIGFLLFFVFIENAIAKDRRERVVKEFELRLGAGIACGTCFIAGASPNSKLEIVPQIFADFLFPVWENEATTHWIGIGPYGKATYLGFLPQHLAAGIATGYQFNEWQVLVNTGIAYSIGDRPETTLARGNAQQTRGTYDLGLTVRRDIGNSVFVSAGYNHNSNGSDLGINIFGSDKIPGTNPGYDSVLVGIGMRF